MEKEREIIPADTNKTQTPAVHRVPVERRIARKRKRAAIVRNSAITVICVILGIVISIQYKSLSAADNLSAADSDKIASLQAQQLKLIQENEELITAKEELQTKVDMLESATNREQIERLEKELNQVKMFCGMTKVTGRGVYISLNTKDELSPATLQRYLLLLINELRASTAQAISINGERITAMTEIRVTTTNYISVNGMQLVAPYEIYAIGNQQSLLSGLVFNGGPLTLIQNDQKCDVIYSMQDNIIINECRTEDIVTGLLKNVE